MSESLFDRALAHRAEVFWNVYQRSTCAVERRRAQFFALLSEGRSIIEVLGITRYSRVTAYKLTGQHHEHGLDALRDGRHANQGAPRILSAEEQQQLAARLHEDFAQDIVWSGQDLQVWIEQRFGKTVYLGRTYELMRAAGFSPQKPRPRHVNGDPAAQEDFKTKS